MAYLVLFDKNFSPLGSPAEGEISTVHVCKSWSLKRKAFEFDEFKAVCKGYKDSKNAVYAGLFENDGRLIYRCLSGIPTTKDDLTTVNGIDVRQVFNQEVPVDYSSAFGNDGKTSAYDIYRCLLNDSMANIASGVSYSGVPYSYDTSNVSSERLSNEDDQLISPTKKVRNIWEQIQACNANFSCVLVAEWKNDRKTNFYGLTFKVKPVFNLFTVRLKDFDIKRTLNQNVVNHVRVYNSSMTSVVAEYYLLKRPSMSTENIGGYTKYKFTYITQSFSEDVCFPIRSQAFVMDASDTSETSGSGDGDTEDDNRKKACEEAVQTLLESISKDRITIDLNTKYGKMLDGIDISDMGSLVGYYSADGSEEDKCLPVSAIQTDSNGTKKVEFGRLSEYWFME